MWNIGKIWLRFFTKKEVKIKYHDQLKLNSIVDGNVQSQQIRYLIKRLLTWNRKERISFEEFLMDDFFIKEQENQTSFYTSVLGHLKTISSMGIFLSKDHHEIDSNNPFVKEIRYRCFLEYLDVDLYFVHVIN